MNPYLHYFLFRKNHRANNNKEALIKASFPNQENYVNMEKKKKKKEKQNYAIFTQKIVESLAT